MEIKKKTIIIQQSDQPEELKKGKTSKKGGKK